MEKGNKVVQIPVEPPIANRGAQSTSENSLSACVDWLSVTFLDEENPEVILDVFGLGIEDFIEMPKGRYGYKKMLFYNHIAVLFDGHEDMGIHIEMSGQGCRYFEQDSEINWNELFIRLSTDYKYVTNVKRLDLAIDDTVGYFKITQAINNVKRGNCVSLFRKAKRISNLDIQQGGEFGHTLYFGAPSSRVMFRFYDKLEEMKAKKKVVNDEIKFWNRIEVSLTEERAEAVVMILAHEHLQVGEIVQGLLRRYIQFKTKNCKDSNKYRWELTPWYKKFLNDVQPLYISTKLPDKSIERSYHWVNKAVIKTIAMLSISFENDLETMLEDFIEDGKEKLKPTDYQIIEAFKKRNMSYEEFIKYLNSMETTFVDENRSNREKEAIEGFLIKKESSGHEDSKVREI